MSVETGPIMGEPLPIELANATYAVRGRLRDGLETVAQLAAWFEQVGPRLALPVVPDAVDAGDLALARELRDAIRNLAAAAVNETVPPVADVETLNRHVRAAPYWRELRWSGAPAASPGSAAAAAAAALSAIAQDAVDLFTGAELANLRACRAPGCVLFFVKDHHRRQWCSDACGNRARAARHHARQAVITA
ncbi:CGNR zinc finger domain-containing protein [Nonomuraea typhae]|uniref:CGNR zinc finger domain-containing protein n=1 Tax=Nonomuraea typhae TaxID=2603600 RepID=UPI001FED0E11|nr:CGNR zinc finger domain-containing protein [Nonomuraea typhae]